MREYPRTYAKEFLKRAKIFLSIAEQNKDDFPKEACFNAIQSVINANDAFTICTIEQRASKDHREAIKLHKIASEKLGESKVSTLLEALDLRDATGYDIMKHVSKQSCELMIKRAERFIDWVERKIDRNINQK